VDPKRVLVVSLKYSPVHGAHCLALGEPLREMGYDVRYLLSNALGWTLPDEAKPFVRFTGSSRNVQEVIWDSIADRAWRRADTLEFLRDVQPAAVVFESSHPSNEVIAVLARRACPGTSLWMLVHEPHVADKGKHGLPRSLIIAGHEWTLQRLTRCLDGVLLASEEAVQQFRAAYPDFGGTVLRVPLLFADRASSVPGERHYFSFIGHAVPAKGIDVFFQMVETSASLGRQWQFQIATSTSISRHLRGLSPAARRTLRAVSRPRLSDGEIDEAIRGSWAVLAPYRRVTQSGVLPVAFMHGTPVISTRAGGMPEFVVPGETGYLVEQDARFDDWEARLGPSYLRPMLDAISPSSCGPAVGQER
jgi:glycosyltransferase involved in cell wall biosynthesis